MKAMIWRVVILALSLAPARLASAQNTIRIRLENKYVVYLNLGFGSAARAGTDIVSGTLTLQANGTWTGAVDADVDLSQELKGLGRICPMGRFLGSQRLDVRAKAVSGFNSKSQTITYRSGTANGGFLELEVKPAAAPNIQQNAPCVDMYQNDQYALPLLPLNDGRWTQPGSGYVIGLPQRGMLEYDDVTLAAAPNNPQPSGGMIPASSKWTIRVQRP
jgi:hypothetical protein